MVSYDACCCISFHLNRCTRTLSWVEWACVGVKCIISKSVRLTWKTHTYEQFTRFNDSICGVRCSFAPEKKEVHLFCLSFFSIRFVVCLSYIAFLTFRIRLHFILYTLKCISLSLSEYFFLCFHSTLLLSTPSSHVFVVAFKHARTFAWPFAQISRSFFSVVILFFFFLFFFDYSKERSERKKNDDDDDGDDEGSNSRSSSPNGAPFHFMLLSRFSFSPLLAFVSHTLLSSRRFTRNVSMSNKPDCSYVLEERDDRKKRKMKTNSLLVQHSFQW